MTTSRASGRPSNTALVVKYFEPLWSRAVNAGLMQVDLRSREGRVVTLADGRRIVEFVNCSYLGLDVHPSVIDGAQRVIREWGVHFCCARSRFSIGPTRELEDGLSRLFQARAITFPSVTSAHASLLPLIASGVILSRPPRAGVRLIIDEYAHASMQQLRPLLERDARIETVPHNDLDAVRTSARHARERGEEPVYVADGLYSMGGACPLRDLIALSDELGLHLYLDDAHGTSIFGDRGEGYVLANLGGPLPPNVFVAFSLAKGFGCNGGGVIVSTPRQERLVRSFGHTYTFSGPLDFSIVGAARASLALHEDGTVRALQSDLRDRVALLSSGCVTVEGGWSPIRMIPIGDAEQALDCGERLLAQGFFVSVVMFPVVPIGRSQLRVCVGASHSSEQIRALGAAIDEVVACPTA